jgi:hypothetical protein
MMSDAQLHFGGVPTGPDVKKIRDRWPDGSLKAGDKISYEQMASVIGHNKADTRFKTVTQQWRKAVEEATAGRVSIGTIPGEGFIVLDDSQKHSAAVGKLRSAGRAAKRSVILTSFVDASNLTEDERARHYQLQVRNAAVLGALQVRGNGKALPSLTSK